MTEPAIPKIVTRDDWERARAEFAGPREDAHACRRRTRRRSAAPADDADGAGHGSGSGRLHLSARCVRRPAHADRVSLHVNKGAPHHKQCEGCTHSQTAMNSAVCAYLAERDVKLRRFQQRSVERDRRLPRLHGLDDAVVLDRRLRRCAWRPETVAISAATYETGDQCSKRMKRSGEGSKPCCPHYSCSTSLRTVGRNVGGLTRRVAQEPSGSWWRRDGRPIAQWTRTNAAVK